MTQWVPVLPFHSFYSCYSLEFPPGSSFPHSLPLSLLCCRGGVFFIWVSFSFLCSSSFVVFFLFLSFLSFPPLLASSPFPPSSGCLFLLSRLFFPSPVFSSFLFLFRILSFFAFSLFSLAFRSSGFLFQSGFCFYFASSFSFSAVFLCGFSSGSSLFLFRSPFTCRSLFRCSSLSLSSAFSVGVFPSLLRFLFPGFSSSSLRLRAFLLAR